MDTGGHLFLLLELCGPCGLLLVHCTHIVLALKLAGPLILDVFAHGAQGLVLIAAHDSLELADRLVLLGDQLVLLTFGRIGQELGAREQCGLT